MVIFPGRLLREKSHGVPSWCEQLLTDMLYDNILTIIPRSEKHIALAGRRESSVKPDMSAISKRLATDSISDLDQDQNDVSPSQLTQFVYLFTIIMR